MSQFGPLSLPAPSPRSPAPSPRSSPPQSIIGGGAGSSRGPRSVSWDLPPSISARPSITLPIIRIEHV